MVKFASSKNFLFGQDAGLDSPLAFLVTGHMEIMVKIVQLVFEMHN